MIVKRKDNHSSAWLWGGSLGTGWPRVDSSHYPSSSHQSHLLDADKITYAVLLSRQWALLHKLSKKGRSQGPPWTVPILQHLLSQVYLPLPWEMGTVHCLGDIWEMRPLHPNYRSSIWHISICWAGWNICATLTGGSASSPWFWGVSPAPHPFLSKSWWGGAPSLAKWLQHQSDSMKELIYPETETHSHLVVDASNCSSFYLEPNQFLTNMIQGKQRRLEGNKLKYWVMEPWTAFFPPPNLCVCILLWVFKCSTIWIPFVIIVEQVIMHVT